MQDNEQFSPEESEGRNQQLFSDLRQIYHNEVEKETTQHVNLVRERLLQKRDVPAQQQNGTFKQPVVLESLQQRAEKKNDSYARPNGSYEKGRYHYLSTIAAIILVSVLVGSFVLVFAHFHASKSEGPVITPKSIPTRATWSLTGSMHMARTAHTATLLRNGKVLVVGEIHLMTETHRYGTTAELYDPATGKWSLTGSLHIARDAQTATLLPNGEVLVAGGDIETGITASAELYNPTTGTWSVTGSMHVARVTHTATLLRDGKVLVTGGYGNRVGPYTSAELYDPTTGTWSFTGSMHYHRSAHTATLLENGEVLAAGGVDAETELYNPSTGLWTLTGNMHIVRAGQTATLLLNGEVLLTGGNNDRGLFASAELYNPTTGKWTLTGSMHDARISHTATLLPDGKVLVVGGERDFFGLQVVTSTELYDPVTETWSLTAHITVPRGDQTATLLPIGKVLVAGGFANGNDLDSAELYTPAHT